MIQSLLNEKRKKPTNIKLVGFVLGTGLEPVRTNVHWILSPTCLPIPPPERIYLL